jgi:two-component system phosphate regulon sensor histidine kinase PhoR
MRSSWSQEAWRLIGVLIFCLLLGLLTGHVQNLLLIGLAGGVVWYLYNLYRLQRWLESPRRDNVPPETGVWGDLYYRVLKLQANSLSRKRRLRAWLSQFRASAEALPDGAVAMGEYWEIRWFNDAAARLLDLHPGKDVGTPIVNLFRNPAFTRYLEGEDFSEPLAIAVPGVPNSRLSIRVIPYGDGQWLLLAQDVTERHRLERIRTDFVANVSHELRTPLTVLSGYIENLRHGKQEYPDAWSRPLQQMEQQTIRMQNIVEDLLLLARLESNQPGQRQESVVDVANLAKQLKEEAESARSDGHAAVHLDISCDSGLVGDPAQLRGAFTNLVMNAVNYTPENGDIYIRWYVDRSDHPCFEVADTGEGIAAEHIPRLTERFYRVDAGRSRQRGGTGLGLAIVKHALQNHQAELIIESRLGQGSVFLCRFPNSRLADTQQDIAAEAKAGS